MGKQSGESVRFSFWQQAIWSALGLEAGDRREASAYQVYLRPTGGWQRIPSKAITLTVGEGVIYCQKDVKKPLRFEEYVLRVTPPPKLPEGFAAARGVVPIMVAGSNDDPIIIA